MGEHDRVIVHIDDPGLRRCRLSDLMRVVRRGDTSPDIQELADTCFPGQEEIILEIAGDAFRVIFEPVERLVGSAGVATVADLVAASIDPIGSDVTVDAAGQPVPVDELLRCAVQAWGELLRHEGLRRRAVDGFEQFRRRMAEVLRHGQAAGTVPPALDPDRGTRVVMALLHGYVLQRVAFGLDDTEGFTQDVRAALADAGVLHAPQARPVPPG